MAITATVIDKIDRAGILGFIRGDELGYFAAQSYQRRLTQYVPMQTGTLFNSADVRPWEIEYNQPYARYLYGGIVYGPNYPITEGGRIVGYFSQPGKKKHSTGRAIQFNRDYHPKACAKWDKVAEPVQKPILIREMQRFINRRLRHG